MPYAYARDDAHAKRIRTAVYTLGATSIATIRDASNLRVTWDDETIDPDYVLDYLAVKGRHADRIAGPRPKGAQ